MVKIQKVEIENNNSQCNYLTLLTLQSNIVHDDHHDAKSGSIKSTSLTFTIESINLFVTLEHFFLLRQDFILPFHLKYWLKNNANLLKVKIRCDLLLHILNSIFITNYGVMGKSNDNEHHWIKWHNLCQNVKTLPRFLILWINEANDGI